MDVSLDDTLVAAIFDTIVVRLRSIVRETQTHFDFKQFLFFSPITCVILFLLVRVEWESSDNSLDGAVLSVLYFVVVGQANAAE